MAKVKVVVHGSKGRDKNILHVLECHLQGSRAHTI
jgi:hypothetical protein